MGTVHLDWSDGTSVDVPALWLRDNCPCASCRVVATSERRKLIATEPLDLTPLAIRGDHSGVTVDWGTHESHYSLDWYRTIQLEAARHRVAPDPWTAELELPVFHYADLDDTSKVGQCEVIRFLSSFAARGIALVKGVPCYRGESERFLARWAPARELPFGRVHDVWVDPHGYNIAHTAEALPPHTDFASYHWPPTGQLLHMLVNDAEGGDSIVVDGWCVASRLPEEDLRVLSSFEVPFRQWDDRSETWTRAPMLSRRADGSVSHIRFSNQLMQAIDPTAAELDAFYAAYHRLSNMVLDPANQKRFRLEAGDLLVVHGHRVLHGRHVYDPSTGARHLQDVYFEFDDLVNRLYRLEEGRR